MKTLLEIRQAVEAYNPRESWLDCQARALYQAAALVQTAAEGRRI